MNRQNEAKFSLPGTQQGIGYGKNYHTQDPEPINWENLTKLDYYVTSMPDGSFLAGVSLPDSDLTTPAYKFNNEEEAMMWIRTTSERYNIQVANQ